jgi:hypothetical protein
VDTHLLYDDNDRFGFEVPDFFAKSDYGDPEYHLVIVHEAYEFEPEEADIRLEAKCLYAGDLENAQELLESYRSLFIAKLGEEIIEDRTLQIEINGEMRDLIAEFNENVVLTTFFNIGKYVMFIQLTIAEEHWENENIAMAMLELLRGFQTDLDPDDDGSSTYTVDNDGNGHITINVDVGQYLFNKEKNMQDESFEIGSLIPYELDGASIRLPDNFNVSTYTKDGLVFDADCEQASQDEEEGNHYFGIKMSILESEVESIEKVAESLRDRVDENELAEMLHDEILNVNGVPVYFNYIKVFHRRFIWAHYFLGQYLLKLEVNSTTTENELAITKQVLETFAISDKAKFINRIKNYMDELIANRECFDFIDLDELEDSYFESGGMVNKSVRHYLTRNFAEYVCPDEDLSNYENSFEVIQFIQSLEAPFDLSEKTNEALHEFFNKMFVDIVNIVTFTEYMEEYHGDGNPNGESQKAFYLLFVKGFYEEMIQSTDYASTIERYTELFSKINKYFFGKTRSNCAAEFNEIVIELNQIIAGLGLDYAISPSEVSEPVLEKRLAQFGNFVPQLRSALLQRGTLFKDGTLNGLQMLKLFSDQFFTIDSEEDFDEDSMQGVRHYNGFELNHDVANLHPEALLVMSELSPAMVQTINVLQENAVFKEPEELFDFQNEVLNGSELSFFTVLLLFTREEAKILDVKQNAVHIGISEEYIDGEFEHDLMEILKEFCAFLVPTRTNIDVEFEPIESQSRTFELGSSFGNMLTNYVADRYEEEEDDFFDDDQSDSDEAIPLEELLEEDFKLGGRIFSNIHSTLSTIFEEVDPDDFIEYEDDDNEQGEKLFEYNRLKDYPNSSFEQYERDELISKTFDKFRSILPYHFVRKQYFSKYDQHFSRQIRFMFYYSINTFVSISKEHGVTNQQVDHYTAKFAKMIELLFSNSDSLQASSVADYLGDLVELWTDAPPIHKFGGLDDSASELSPQQQRIDQLHEIMVQFVQMYSTNSKYFNNGKLNGIEAMKLLCMEKVNFRDDLAYDEKNKKYVFSGAHFVVTEQRALADAIIAGHEILDGILKMVREFESRPVYPAFEKIDRTDVKNKIALGTRAFSMFDMFRLVTNYAQIIGSIEEGITINLLSHYYDGPDSNIIKALVTKFLKDVMEYSGMDSEELRIQFVNEMSIGFWLPDDEKNHDFNSVPRMREDFNTEGNTHGFGFDEENRMKKHDFANMIRNTNIRSFVSLD